MNESEARRLEQRIDAMIADEFEDAIRAARKACDPFYKANAVQSSRRLVFENEAFREQFRISLAKMAWLIFQAAGNDGEAEALLIAAAQRLEERILARADKNMGRLDHNRQIHEDLIEKLARHRTSAITDFGMGIAGGATLKKGADLNITNVMQNSPGGVQGGAGGDVHQKVVHQVYAPLIQQLDELSNGAEFKKLAAEKQEEVRDLVEAVRDAASEPNPNPKKVQRWGTRLMQQLDEFGLAVAANTVGALLAQLLSGG